MMWNDYLFSTMYSQIKFNNTFHVYIYRRVFLSVWMSDYKSDIQKTNNFTYIHLETYKLRTICRWKNKKNSPRSSREIGILIVYYENSRNRYYTTVVSKVISETPSQETILNVSVLALFETREIFSRNIPNLTYKRNVYLLT